MREGALLLLTRGRGAVPEVRALSARINEMTEGYADPLGEDGRYLVDTARERESRAVELLSTM